MKPLVCCFNVIIYACFPFFFVTVLIFLLVIKLEFLIVYVSTSSTRVTKTEL